MSIFLGVMSLPNINPNCFYKLNTRRVIGQWRGGAVEGVVVPINPTVLIDAELRESLTQMAQAITMQAQSMTDQVNRQNV